MGSSVPLAGADATEETVTVACNRCGATHQFDPTIQAETGAPDGDDWQLSVAVTAEGSVQIHEAYCPKHRLTQAIDEAVDASNRLSRSTNRLSSAVGELRTDDS